MIDIMVLLDRSGSMEKAVDDHIGGLRSFVRDQRELGDDALLTLIQFDDTDPHEIIFDRKPIRNVNLDEITLIPRGWTPLLDAMGKALAHLEKQQKALASDQTIVMIITDGVENHSREWSKAQISQRVADLEKRGWKFLYLGADLDAFHEAGSMGVATVGALNMSHQVPGSVGVAYAATSRNLRSARLNVREAGIRGASAGQAWNASSALLNYSAEQRTATATGTPLTTNTVELTDEERERMANALANVFSAVNATGSASDGTVSGGGGAATDSKAEA